MNCKKYFYLCRKFKPNFMQYLDKIIQESSLITKRALVIKMTKLKYSIEEICNLLSVKKSFIEKWRAIYNKEGAKNLSPKYKGSKGFLDNEQLKEIYLFLKNKTTCHLEELISYIKDKYGFYFKSKQSYYDILSTAGMSWKKTEKVNPKKDEALVAQKKEDIKKNSRVEKTKYVPGVWSY